MKCSSLIRKKKFINDEDESTSSDSNIRNILEATEWHRHDPLTSIGVDGTIMGFLPKHYVAVLRSLLSSPESLATTLEYDKRPCSTRT